MKKAFDLHPAIKHIQLSTKSAVLTRLLGSYRSVFRGHGLEFDSYRPYTTGDDAHTIDWKASSRSNQVLVKEYIEERNITVFLMIDVSDSMLVGSSKDPLKMQYAAELGAFLCSAVVQSEDAIGWGLFSKNMVTFTKPKSDNAQFYRFARDIVNPKHYGGSMNLDKALDETSRFLPEKSIVILVSDFIGMKPQWHKSLRVFSQKYDFISIILHDPFDHTLPTDDVYLILEHPTTGEQTVINPLHVRKEFERLSRQYDRSIQDKFKKWGIDYLHMSTHENFVGPLIRFFKRRKARWR